MLVCDERGEQKRTMRRALCQQHGGDVSARRGTHEEAFELEDAHEDRPQRSPARQAVDLDHIEVPRCYLQWSSGALFSSTCLAAA